MQWICMSNIYYQFSGSVGRSSHSRGPAEKLGTAWQTYFGADSKLGFTTDGWAGQDKTCAGRRGDLCVHSRKRQQNTGKQKSFFSSESSEEEEEDDDEDEDEDEEEDEDADEQFGTTWSPVIYCRCFKSNESGPSISLEPLRPSKSPPSNPPFLLLQTVCRMYVRMYIVNVCTYVCTL